MPLIVLFFSRLLFANDNSKKGKRKYGIEELRVMVILGKKTRTKADLEIRHGCPFFPWKVHVFPLSLKFCRDGSLTD